VFDPAGKYLYFISNRDFNEVLGNIDFEFANPKTARVYLVTLRTDEPSPFPALSDEVAIKRKSLRLPPRLRRKGRTRGRTSRRRKRRKKTRNRNPTIKMLPRISRLTSTASRIVSSP